MMTMMPDWVHYEADQMVTDDLEHWWALRSALERGAVRAKTDQYTLQVSSPHRTGASRLAYQLWEPKLREIQDGINRMLAAFDEATQRFALASHHASLFADAQRRDVEDVARKAWHVAQRDEPQRIGAHAAWLSYVQCWRMVHPEGTFRGEDIRPYMDLMKEHANQMAAFSVGGRKWKAWV